MATRRTPPKKTDPKVPVVQGPRVRKGISFPVAKQKREAKSVGVTVVRRSNPGAAPTARTMGGYAAAEACNLFGRPNKGGGHAFAGWLRTNHPEASRSRLSAADWAPMLHEFAERPIHGHRRTSRGGNHRINKTHRR